MGIDLGTTRTVVAVCDRGNYPVVGFTAADGDLIDHVPTTTAEVDGLLGHGHAAEEAARAGAPALRSWTRLLGAGASADQVVQIGAVTRSLLELTTDFLVVFSLVSRRGSADVTVCDPPYCYPEVVNLPPMSPE